MLGHRAIVPLCVWAVLVGGVFTSLVEAVSPVEPYWRINEYSQPNPAEHVFPFTDVWFQITNMHPTNAIVGFGVGMPDQPDMIVEQLGGPGAGWQVQLADEGIWNEDTVWTGLPAGMTLADYFGLAFEDAFPGCDEAYVAWSDLSAVSPGQILAQTTFGDDSFTPGEEFFYTYSIGAPASPAIVRLQDGSYLGPTGQQNPFDSQATPIPVPGALLLASMGAGLVGWFRRRGTR